MLSLSASRHLFSSRLRRDHPEILDLRAAESWVSDDKQRWVVCATLPLVFALEITVRLKRCFFKTRGEPGTEGLTRLGHHLAALPLPPPAGKLLLYGLLFRCLDPLLTIACGLAYR